MLQKIIAWVYDKPVYRLSLRSLSTNSFTRPPHSPWPPDKQNGSDLIKNGLGAGRHCFDPATNIDTTQIHDDALEQWHRFSWLGDMASVGTDEARTTACRWLASWLDHFSEWDSLAWRPDLIAERLTQSLHALPWLSEQHPTCYQALLRELPRQAKHLSRTAPGFINGVPRLMAISGLIHAGVLIFEKPKYLERGIRLLQKELLLQIHPDGGHYQRNPAIHLSALAVLTDIRALLHYCHKPMPMELQKAIDRMTPMLRGLRHGDGRLAVFNGAAEAGRYPVDLVLLQAGGRARPMTSAPHTGYYRLSAGRTLVIVDAGRPTTPVADHIAHAGTLAFELSSGSQRIVVNCGPASSADKDWQLAMRSTPAHSTLSLDNMNSTELPDSDTSKPVTWPDVQCVKREDQRNQLLDLSHNGYEKTLGVVHNRLLYLANDGNDFRGEDQLTGRGSYPYAIRFHLHPKVRASLAQSGDTIHLRLANGNAWKFRCSGGRLKLEDSLYFGSGDRRRCLQIIIEGTHSDNETTIKWRFNRV